MKSGIYKIENIVNGKIYVGRSHNINKRLGAHKSELRHNKHGNQHLQAAWNKYGETNFICLPIEYCELEFLKKREEFWIKELQTLDRDKGYNIKEEDTQGRYTEEYKKIIGEKSKAILKAHYDKQKAEGKLQVVIIHLETEVKEYYTCLNDVPYSIKNKKFNFIEKVFRSFTYNKTEEQIQEEFKAVQLRYENYLKLQIPHPDGNYKQRRKSKITRGEHWPVQFKNDFETLNFKTSQEAANYFGITVAQICVAKTNGKYTKTMFYLINNNGIIDEAKNLKQLAQQNNHNHNGYKKVMSGIRKNYLGYIIHRNDTVFEVQRLS